MIDLIPDFTLSVIKVLTLSACSFVVALFFAPKILRVLYKYQLWRKEVRTMALGGGTAEIFRKLHGHKEIGIPRFGGVLIVGTVFFIAFFVWVLAETTGADLAEKFNFISRNQTWLPLAMMLAGSMIGIADDLLQTLGKGAFAERGLRATRRVALVALMGLAAAWWFYSRLEWRTIHIPGGELLSQSGFPLVDPAGNIFIGWLYIPLFVFVTLAVFSGGVMDGLDGLAGGVFATIFFGFGTIALARNQIDIAAFCAVVVGALLAFLWFNLPPARFYMGESGVVALTAALTVVAFLTDSVLVLPIIALILVIESLSVIIQVLSKKLRHGKKIFLIAPLHHHFEARGWPAYAVTMRFWLVSAIAATVGVAIRLIG